MRDASGGRFGRARLGVDLGPLIESRLRHWWHELVPRMWNAMHSGLARIERRRPRALLFYTPSSAEEARCRSVTICLNPVDMIPKLCASSAISSWPVLSICTIRLPCAMSGSTSR